MTWLPYVVAFIAGAWFRRWLEAFRAARLRRRIRSQIGVATATFLKKDPS